MKGMRLLLTGLLALTCLSAAAESPIRYQYKNNGITHVSADYERIELKEAPFWLRVESVVFSDGSAAWILYMNFEGAKALSVPKGVKMAATLPNGKVLRLEQIGTDNATKRALRRDKESFYLNRTKYMVEPEEMTGLLSGVSTLEVITGWDPDDYLTLSFPGNEFSQALSAQVAAIRAAGKTDALTGEITRYADSNNSLTVFSRPVVAKGAAMIYNTGLTYLYYKTTGKEDFDLSIQLGTEQQYRIPVESEVVFMLFDGTQVALKQTREEKNSLFLYPSVSDVRRMVRTGVRSVVIQTADGPVNDTFTGRSFSDALAAQYQLLMSVSPM